MPENKIQEVADAADMIVAGYAFTKTENGFVRVLNINNPDEAFVLDADGNMLETTADDIAVLKVQAYYLKNKEFMEVSNA